MGGAGHDAPPAGRLASLRLSHACVSVKTNKQVLQQNIVIFPMHNIRILPIYTYEAPSACDARTQSSAAHYAAAG